MRAVLATALLLVIASSGSAAKGAANPKVVYLGQEAGINEGPRDFAYLVDVHEVGSEYPVMEFRVGAGDLDFHHYDNWLLPEGWQFAVGQDDPPFDVPLSCYGGCSEIGGSATLLKHVSTRCVRFWTDKADCGVWSFTFGFDYEGPAGDAGWFLTDDKPASFNESSCVGVGIYDDQMHASGPVHGPGLLPEPGSLWLLALGGAAALRRRGPANQGRLQIA